MIVATRYFKGATLHARLRRSQEYWDFVTAAWGLENNDCHVLLEELPDSDQYTVLYQADPTYPQVADAMEEIIDNGKVVAAGLLHVVNTYATANNISISLQPVRTITINRAPIRTISIRRVTL